MLIDASQEIFLKLRCAENLLKLNKINEVNKITDYVLKHYKYCENVNFDNQGNEVYLDDVVYALIGNLVMLDRIEEAYNIALGNEEYEECIDDFIFLCTLNGKFRSALNCLDSIENKYYQFVDIEYMIHIFRNNKNFNDKYIENIEKFILKNFDIKYQALIYINISDLYYKLNESNKALKYYKKFTKLNYNLSYDYRTSDSYKKLIDIEIKIGNKDNVKTLYSKIESLDAELEKLDLIVDLFNNDTKIINEFIRDIINDIIDRQDISDISYLKDKITYLLMLSRIIYRNNIKIDKEAKNSINSIIHKINLPKRNFIKFGEYIFSAFKENKLNNLNDIIIKPDEIDDIINNKKIYSSIKELRQDIKTIKEFKRNYKKFTKNYIDKDCAKIRKTISDWDNVKILKFNAKHKYSNKEIKTLEIYFISDKITYELIFKDLIKINNKWKISGKSVRLVKK